MTREIKKTPYRTYSCVAPETLLVYYLQVIEIMFCVQRMVIMFILIYSLTDTIKLN